MNNFSSATIFEKIILPNYNKFNFIEESINSVLNQTFKDWKLYIIDDCSTDNTNQIISDLILEYPFISIIVFEKRTGSLISKDSFCP